MSRVPVVSGDSGTWGTVLNDFLAVAHNADGSITPALTTAISVGGTSVVLGAVPNSEWKVGSYILLSAYTTRAELKQVTAVAGATLTVSACKTAHTSGEEVLLINVPYTITPVMYGCTGTGDDWAPFQRAVIETTALACTFQHTSALAGSTFSVSKPICVPTSSQWRNIGIKTHASYAPVEAAGALVMVASRSWAFSAATNDDFTVTAGHTMSSYSATNHTKVVFVAPYGETLPTGVTAGQVYYIDTVPNSTTFTVSATSGGAKLDITVAGTGWAFESIEDLSRVSWDNVRFDLTVANVHGLRANLQQPSYITNMRIEMDANAATRAYGAVVGGQLGYLTNVEINPSNNCTCLYLYGTGMVVENFNCNGTFSGDVGIEVAGANASTLRNLWTESVAIGVKIPIEVRGLTIDGSWLLSGGNSTSVVLQVENMDASYEVGIIKGGTNGYKILNDTSRSLVMYGTTGAVAANIVSDFQGTYMGHIQQGRRDGDSGYSPPRLKSRHGTGASGGYQIRYVDDQVYVSTGGSPSTVTLPTAVGWDQYEIMIFHYSGAGTCTVACTGAETIDGAATYVVPLGGNVVVVSAGNLWQIISERA